MELFINGERFGYCDRIEFILNDDLENIQKVEITGYINLKMDVIAKPLAK